MFINDSHFDGGSSHFSDIGALIESKSSIVKIFNSGFINIINYDNGPVLNFINSRYKLSLN